MRRILVLLSVLTLGIFLAACGSNGVLTDLGKREFVPIAGAGKYRLAEFQYQGQEQNLDGVNWELFIYTVEGLTDFDSQINWQGLRSQATHSIEVTQQDGIADPWKAVLASEITANHMTVFDRQVVRPETGRLIDGRVEPWPVADNPDQGIIAHQLEGTSFEPYADILQGEFHVESRRENLYLQRDLDADDGDSLVFKRVFDDFITSVSEDYYLDEWGTVDAQGARRKVAGKVEGEAYVQIDLEYQLAFIKIPKYLVPQPEGDGSTNLPSEVRVRSAYRVDKNDRRGQLVLEESVLTDRATDLDQPLTSELMSQVNYPWPSFQWIAVGDVLYLLPESDQEPLYQYWRLGLNP